MLPQRSAVRCPRAEHNTGWHEPQVFRTSSRPAPGGKTLARLNGAAGGGAGAFDAAVLPESADGGAGFPQAASSHPLMIARSNRCEQNVLISPGRPQTPPPSVVSISFLLRG